MNETHPRTLEHHDPFCPCNRRQPMRHDHTRRLPLRQHLVDRVVDPVLARRVQRTRRLVQREDRRALQQRTRDRQPLPLSAAQTLSPDWRGVSVRRSRVSGTRTLGIESLGHAPYKLAIGLPCRVLNLVARRRRMAKRNIGRDRAREQHRVLSGEKKKKKK